MSPLLLSPYYSSDPPTNIIIAPVIDRDPRLSID